MRPSDGSCCTSQFHNLPMCTQGCHHVDTTRKYTRRLVVCFSLCLAHARSPVPFCPALPRPIHIPDVQCIPSSSSSPFSVCLTLLRGDGNPRPWGGLLPCVMPHRLCTVEAAVSKDASPRVSLCRLYRCLDCPLLPTRLPTPDTLSTVYTVSRVESASRHKVTSSFRDQSDTGNVADGRFARASTRQARSPHVGHNLVKRLGVALERIVQSRLALGRCALRLGHGSCIVVHAAPRILWNRRYRNTESARQTCSGRRGRQPLRRVRYHQLARCRINRRLVRQQRLARRRLPTPGPDDTSHALGHTTHTFACNADHALAYAKARLANSGTHGQHTAGARASYTCDARRKRSADARALALAHVLGVAGEFGKHILVAFARAQFEQELGPVQLLDHRLTHLVPRTVCRARLLGRVRGPVAVVKEHLEPRVLLVLRKLALQNVEYEDARLLAQQLLLGHAHALLGALGCSRRTACARAGGLEAGERGDRICILGMALGRSGSIGRSSRLLDAVGRILDSVGAIGFDRVLRGSLLFLGLLDDGSALGSGFVLALAKLGTLEVDRREELAVELDLSLVDASAEVDLVLVRVLARAGEAGARVCAGRLGGELRDVHLDIAERAVLAGVLVVHDLDGDLFAQRVDGRIEDLVPLGVEVVVDDGAAVDGLASGAELDVRVGLAAGEGFDVLYVGGALHPELDDADGRGVAAAAVHAAGHLNGLPLCRHAHAAVLGVLEREPVLLLLLGGEQIFETDADVGDDGVGAKIAIVEDLDGDDGLVAVGDEEFGGHFKDGVGVALDDQGVLDLLAIEADATLGAEFAGEARTLVELLGLVKGEADDTGARLGERLGLTVVAELWLDDRVVGERVLHLAALLCVEDDGRAEVLLFGVFHELLEVEGGLAEVGVGAMLVVVHEGHGEHAVEAVEEDELGLLELRIGGALFGGSLCERVAVVDGEGDVGVGGAAAELDALEVASGPDVDLEDADGGVERSAGHHLFEVDGELVGVVHHGTEVGVDLALDEVGEAGDVANVEAKGVAADGLEDVVDLGRLHEGHVDELYVREVAHELHAKADVADKVDVFEEDGEACADEALAEADGKDDFGVDLLCGLLDGEVLYVGGGEVELPVHHDDVLFGVGEGADRVDTRGLCAESEGGHADGVEEGRAVLEEDLVDDADDGGGEDGFVDEPEAGEEVVDPLCGLVFGDHLLLCHFAGDIVPGALAGASHGGVVVGRAEGADDEEGGDAAAETGGEVGEEDGDHDDGGVPVELAVVGVAEEGADEIHLSLFGGRDGLVWAESLVGAGEAGPSDRVPAGEVAGGLTDGERAWSGLFLLVELVDVAEIEGGVDFFAADVRDHAVTGVVLGGGGGGRLGLEAVHGLGSLCRLLLGGGIFVELEDASACGFVLLQACVDGGSLCVVLGTSRIDLRLGGTV
ncbi:hypothetical protein L1887_53667 [Cichorium endivia]|nr:hypothetical protein L1887_53667 [Cichorium endivia]